MDYGHHDPIHSHRVYSLQAVERAPQPPWYDDGKPGDDDGNPYSKPCHYYTRLGVVLASDSSDTSGSHLKESQRLSHAPTGIIFAKLAGSLRRYGGLCCH